MQVARGRHFRNHGWKVLSGFILANGQHDSANRAEAANGAYSPLPTTYNVLPDTPATNRIGTLYARSTLLDSVCPIASIHRNRHPAIWLPRCSGCHTRQERVAEWLCRNSDHAEVKKKMGGR